MYGISKIQAENLCALYSHNYGLDYVVARCFAFVGSFLPLDSYFAIGNFIKHVFNNEDIVLTGDGSAVRSYLDANDLSQWLWALLLKEKRQVYIMLDQIRRLLF